jgi:hypothetical protein
MRPSPNSDCGWKMIRRASCPKICAANVAWRCANWMKRGKAGFWTRPPASVFKPRRNNSAPAPGTPAGSRRCGKACSARSATNTTSGRCKISPNCAVRWLRGADPAFALQARLLGLSGLLPAELTRAQKSADGYLRRVWDCWWRERDEFSDCILPRAVWKFHGLRPANHPQRRLALAAHWLADGKPFQNSNAGAPRIFQMVGPRCRAARLTGRSALPNWWIRCVKFLEVERDEFWSWHWTFRSARLKKPQPLLGDARVTDLAVNVILPWLWTRAAEGQK